MKCFVIMPFSTTKSCSEKEWTAVFDEMIKPAVEECHYSLICHRSSATRGNIIKDIINDLNEADVVIADLTDQNPNVMYELGVRHSLASKTIIIAQEGDCIPFDLKPYATHEYKWKTNLDKQAFADKIEVLIKDVINRPKRADNPVHDFLGATARSGFQFYSSVREAPQFSPLVDGAKTELFAIGPNLNYVAQNLRDKVFAKARSGVRFRFLVMALDKTPCDLIKDYASAALFHDELKLCHDTFRGWLDDAIHTSLPIEVRVALLVPISINIINGDSPDGTMLVIPIPFRTPGAERPCFKLGKKEHDKAFATYYNQSTKFWNNSVPLA